jgi:presenilin-like A22 family membrane protease
VALFVLFIHPTSDLGLSDEQETYTAVFIIAWLVGYANFMLSLSLKPSQKWIAYVVVAFEVALCYCVHLCDTTLYFSAQEGVVESCMDCGAVITAGLTLYAAVLSEGNRKAEASASVPSASLPLSDPEPG